MYLCEHYNLSLQCLLLRCCTAKVLLLLYLIALYFIRKKKKLLLYFVYPRVHKLFQEKMRELLLQDVRSTKFLGFLNRQFLVKEKKHCRISYWISNQKQTQKTDRLLAHLHPLHEVPRSSLYNPIKLQYSGQSKNRQYLFWKLKKKKVTESSD